MDFFLLLFSLFAFNGNGQSEEADTLRVDLDPVRIEAARLTETSQSAPFAVTAREIPEVRRLSTPAPTLADPLRGFPGLWVNDRNNFALGERLSVRGMGWRAAFGVRGVYILLDGVPLTMPDGQAIMSLVDPSFISHAELIRGPSSVFWGNGGGGALLLSTQNFTDETEVRARFTGGSFGYYKTDLESSFRLGSNRYMVYGSHLYQDGFRDHSRFEAWRLGGHADIDTGDDSRLNLTAAFLESPISDNPGALTADEAQNDPDLANPGSVDQNARKITRHGQAGVRYRLFFDQSELDVNAYGLARRLQNPLPFAWIQVDRLTAGMRTTWQFDADDFDLGLGVDASVQSDSRRNWENEGGDQGDLTLDQQEDVYNIAGFSRLSIPFGSFTISGGVRVDWLDFRNNDRFLANEDASGDRKFWAVSPMAGITYDWRQTQAYVNFSTGFESPTTTELVNRPDMTGGFNPDLQPERSYGIETGFRGILAAHGLQFDAAVFTMWVNDLLLPFRTEEGGDRDFYRNAGATRHSGFELMGEWNPTASTMINVAYSFSDFRFASDEFEDDDENIKGNRLPGIPVHRISGMVQYDFRGLITRVETEFVDRYYVNNVNSEQNDAYALVNLNLSYQSLSLSDRVRVYPFVQINNVFDTRYNGSVIINAFGGRYFEPAPGINWQAGINVRFGSSGR